MVQFAVKDVGFFKNGIQIQQRSPRKILLAADWITFKITKKKGPMGETLTHETVLDIDHVPVQAVTLQVNPFMDNGVK